MRLVFMGTPDFAVPSLKALIKGGHEIVAVYTQPDRPAGRGKKLKASPVKEAAQELGLTVLQPAKIKAPEVLEELKVLAPECIIVVAYGQLLSVAILNLPVRGCINVHASLLPMYRGAAPIHWAVINGEQITGITTMLMDEGLDTGDILLKAECPVAPDLTTGELHDKLAQMGGELLLETLAAMEAGQLKSIAQTGLSSYAPLLKREHESINWNQSAQGILNLIRGLNPWPGAYTLFRGEPLKVWYSKVCSDDNFNNQAVKETPGTILKTGEGIYVQTGQGVLEVLEVQPQGKRSMQARDFFHGRHIQPGEKFGEELSGK